MTAAQAKELNEAVRVAVAEIADLYSLNESGRFLVKQIIVDSIKPVINRLLAPPVTPS
jgi:hypothetical protein